MPRFDGTGPSGQGPMTGGARGPCNPNSQGSPVEGAYRPGAGARLPVAPVYGRGRPRWGLGRGFRGRGFRGGRGRGRW